MKFCFVPLVMSLILSTTGHPGYSQQQNSFNLDSLIHKMTEEAGGDSAIVAIKTHVSKYLTKTIGKNNEIEEVTISTATFKRPNKIRFDLFDTHNQLTFSVFTNGTDSWAYTPSTGMMTTHPTSSGEFISWAEHWIDEWRVYKDIALQVDYIDDVIVGEAPCYKMRVTDRFGIESYWYVNKETYLMKKVEYPSIDLFTGETTGVRQQEFTNYHYVGVIFPTKEIETQGEDQQIREMVKWAMNNPVSDSIFEVNQVDMQATSQHLLQIVEGGAYVVSPSLP